MFEENMIVQLKGIGMSEYESKVYLMLICINSASPRELHETTQIPRGRVYDVLLRNYLVPSSPPKIRSNIALLFFIICPRAFL